MHLFWPRINPNTGRRVKSWTNRGFAFVGAFVLHWIMWFVRRREGVKVELAFREIPVE